MNCYVKPISKLPKWIIHFFLFGVTFCTISFAGTQRQAPIAQNGVLDLRSWDFDQNESISLNGQWLFYWEKLISPKNNKNISQTNEQTIYVPKVWNASDQLNSGYPRFGFGTYQLTVLLPQSKGILGLLIPEIGHASKIWVNGELVYSKGVVGTDRNTMVPGSKKELVSFQPQGSRVTILIQASNFVHRVGGIRYSIKLGKIENLQQKQLVLFGSELIASIALVFMALYHASIFLLFRKNRSTLVFSAICCFSAIIILVTGEAIIQMIFPDIPWSILQSIEYLSMPVLLTLFIIYTDAIFLDNQKSKLKNILILFGSLLTLTVLFTPVSFFSQNLYIQQAFMLAVAVYGAYIVAIKSVKKARLRLIFLTSGMILAGSAINDTLYYQSSISTGNILHIGFLIFLFAQSVILTIRHFDVFRLEQQTSKQNEKLLEKSLKVENELRKSEEKYRLLVENTETPITYVDLDGKVLFMNKIGLEGLNIDIEDAVGNTVFDLIPSISSSTKEQISAMILSGSGSFVENCVKLPNEERWYFSSFQPVKDENNIIQTIQIISHDITENKRAEEALRKIEFSLKKAQEIAHLGSWEWNFKDEKLYLSDEMKRILHLDKDQSSIHYLEIYENHIHPEDRDKVKKQVEKVLESNESGISEYRIIRPDKRIATLVSQADFIFDENKTRIGLVGFTQDVTLQKKADVEMLRLRTLLNNIINSMPSVLIGVDKDGKVMQWNKEAEKATGLTQDQAEGSFFVDVFPQYSSEIEQIRQAIIERKILKGKKAGNDVDNANHSEVMVYPLITNGVEGAVIRIDDVTERVRMEKTIIQTEKMMSLGGLAGGMAHEINNPLAGMLLGAQNILKRFSPSMKANKKVADKYGIDLNNLQSYLEDRKIVKSIKGIQESGERAAKVVVDMLKFSRNTPSQMEKVDIADLIETSLKIARKDYNIKKQYDFRHIKIIKEIKPNIPGISCNASEIEQVILNLLKNAAHAMIDSVQDKTPTIDIRVKTEDNWMKLEIEDNGSGMEDHVKSKIFEPFYTTKPAGVGTGLGLSVSYMIITNIHNGIMEVESELNRGTKFTIGLPIEQHGITDETYTEARMQPSTAKSAS